ncbi:MAG TPA: HPr(Ser) kinase/phosphatase [Burkholderiales bacterium]|nr:HPr(Ser) kinase/phosphatase [Burkholderiales bacterium]
MPKISVTQLFEDNRDKLRLEWTAGRDGGGKAIDSERFRESREGLIGHLNFIHANWVQVFDQPEIAHLDALDPAVRQQMLHQLATSGLACMIVAGGHPAPPALTALADATQTALLSSPVPSVELMALLRPYLLRALAESVTMHGVLLDVLGLGVLLTGNSGVGKSELALELISRGSGLVADDVVELYRVAPETIEGRCPPMLKNYLEVRGLGVLDVRTIFGEAALRPRKNLKLVVHLEKPAGADQLYLERLPLKPGTQDILGVGIHRVTIPVAAGRNLAVLTEAAVRDYVLRLRGIDSTREFIERQARQIDGDGPPAS